MKATLKELKTAAQCRAFAKRMNASAPGLAMQARRQGLSLQAIRKGGYKNAMEKEIIEAVYAYEEVLSQRRGRKIVAARTWQLIARLGLAGAVERVVARETDASGYTALAEMGLADLAFEAVVLRHSEEFAVATVDRARDRLAKYTGPLYATTR